MKKLKVALVAGTMPMYPGVAGSIYSVYQKDLLALSVELGFELVIYKELVTEENQAKTIRMYITSKGIDLLLIFHPTYISGDVAFELMKTDACIGLWGIEEPDKEGPLTLTSFICLVQNSAIAGRCFEKSRKKFKWFFGSTSGKYFKPRFEITVRVLTAIKNLKGSKIAQIGEIAEGHRDSYYNDEYIKKYLGVGVVKGISVRDVLDIARKIDTKAVKKQAYSIISGAAKVEVGEKKIIDSVKVFQAVRTICEERELQAVAFSCWPEIWKLGNLTACLSNSLLNSAGIPASCEADILSAVSMLVMKLLSGENTALMDLPKFDDADDTILLWHCGSAPVEMSGGKGVNCSLHYRGVFEDKSEFAGLGPVTDMVFKESDITVFRLSGKGDEFYYFTGRTLDGKKKSWSGSRGWVGRLKLYNKDINAAGLANTIILNSIHHHFPMVLKDISKYLKEFAYWMDLNRINRIDYDDSLDVM